MNFLGKIGQQILTPPAKEGEQIVGGNNDVTNSGFDVSEYDAAETSDAAKNQQALNDRNIDRSSFNVISKAATDRLGEVQRMIENHDWKDNTAIVIPPCFHLVDAAFRKIRGLVTKKQLVMIRQKLTPEETRNVTPKYTNVYGIYFMIIATSRKLAKHVLATEQAKLTDDAVFAHDQYANNGGEAQMHVISGHSLGVTGDLTNDAGDQVYVMNEGHDISSVPTAPVAGTHSSALSTLATTAVSTGSSSSSSHTGTSATVITHDLITPDHSALMGNTSGHHHTSANDYVAAVLSHGTGSTITTSTTVNVTMDQKQHREKLEARPLDLNEAGGIPLSEIPEIWNIIMQESSLRPTNVYYLCGLLHCFKERSSTISSTGVYVGHLTHFKGWNPNQHPDYILERIKIYSKHWKMEVFEDLHALFKLPPISEIVNKKFRKGELLKALIALFYKPGPRVVSVPTTTSSSSSSADGGLEAVAPAVTVTSHFDEVAAEFTVGYKKRESGTVAAATVFKAERARQEVLSGAEVVILKRKSADNTLQHPNEGTLELSSVTGGKKNDDGLNNMNDNHILMTGSMTGLDSVVHSHPLLLHNVLAGGHSHGMDMNNHALGLAQAQQHMMMVNAELHQHQQHLHNSMSTIGNNISVLDPNSQQQHHQQHHVLSIMDVSAHPHALSHTHSDHMQANLLPLSTHTPHAPHSPISLPVSLSSPGIFEASEGDNHVMDMYMNDHSQAHKKLKTGKK